MTSSKDDAYYANLDKRTKEYKEWKKRKIAEERKKPEGLGDTVEQVTKLTGIKWLTEKLFGEDCGCEERKKWLNEKFPYFRNRRGNELTVEEFEILHSFWKDGRKIRHWSSGPKRKLMMIFNRVYNLNYRLDTSCAECIATAQNELFGLYKSYINEAK